MRPLFILVLGALIGAAAMWLAERSAGEPPGVRSVAAASLDSIRAQNRLTVFAGRFTVAVTTRVERLGLAAEKTLIVPATVRYDIDYSRLSDSDLTWDEAARTLTVRLPEIELAEPQVDMAGIREYSGGTVLLTLSNAGETIDAANRAKIRAAVLKEANAPLLRELARASARSAAERGMALPLKAAGIDARVIVRFPDEGGTAL